MIARDPVRELLRARGCAAHVVEGGLAGLLDAWERVVTEVEKGYRGGLDDYLNDMDARQILHDVLPAARDAERAAARARLRAADARMKAQLAPAGPCLWGAANAASHGWTPRRHWWYFRAPLHPGTDLAKELGGR